MPQLSGPAHPKWKGGRIVDRDGYVWVMAPSHPKAHDGKYLEREKMMTDEPQFVYFTADEGVGDLTCDRTELTDHVRCLIAERTGDRAELKELRRLRGEPEGDADVEHAPWLIAIYAAMIAWLAEAMPGNAFKAHYGGTYRIFCVDKETLFDPKGDDDAG
jgi:hypothetical protein